MQKFLRTLTLMALLFVPWVAQAQGNYAKVSEYDFEISRTDYNSIYGTAGAEEVTLTNGTGTVELPWTIHFGETELATNSNITVNRNGSISFADLTKSVVAPMRIPGTISGGKVYKKSTATELVIEWRKIVGGSNSYSFQLAIANNGDIEFRYGPATLASTSVNVAVGLASDTTNATPDRFSVSMVSNRWDSISRTTSWSPNRSVANYYSATHPAYSAATGQGVVYTFTQPACVKPSGVSVSSTTYWDTLNITWAAFAGATQYEVFYTDNATLVPTETTTGTEVLANTPGVKTNTNGAINGYRLGGLNYNTKYYVFVRKYCGTTPSAWVPAGNATTANISTGGFLLSSDGVASWLLSNYPTVNAVQLYYTKNQVADVAALANVAPQVTVLKSDSLRYDLVKHQNLEAETEYFVYYRLRYTLGGATNYVWINLTGDNSKRFTTPYDGDIYIMGTPTAKDVTTCAAVVYDNGGRDNDYANNSRDTLIIRPATANSLVRLQGDFYTEGSTYDFVNIYDGVGTNGTLLTDLKGEGTLDITSQDPTGALTLTFQSDVSVQYWGYALYVSCVPKPTCFAPSALNATAITASGATISWTPNAQTTAPAGGWQVGYRVDGSNSVYTTVSVAGNVATKDLTLAGNTVYEVSVRAICGTGDTTDWASPVTFRTLCDEAIAVTFDDPYTALDFSSLPECWSETSTEGNVNWEPYSDFLNTWFEEGGNSQYLISPAFNLASNGNYRLNFYRYLYDYYSTGIELKVFYRTAATAAWTELETYDETTDDWTQSVIDLPTPGAYYQLAFQAVAGADEDVNAEVDFGYVSIQRIPTCIVPNQLASTPGTGDAATTVVLNWNEQSPTPATQWEVRYAPEGSDLETRGAVVTVNEKPFTLTNLDQTTSYQWQVRSLCSTEDVSDWSAVESFTTNCPVNTEITIGDGTSTDSYLPTYEYYNYSLTQQIFDQSELGGANTFSSVSFYYPNTGTATRTLDIYMVETTKSTFSGNYDWVTVTAADKVYSGSFSIGQGWKTITFDTPFEYSGTKNVVLVVDDNTGSYVSSIAARVTTTTGSAQKSIRVYSDGTNYNPASPSSYSGTRMTVRNNVKLGASCPAGACPPPTVSVATSLSGSHATATLTFTPADENTTDLRYKYGEAGFNPATATEYTVVNNTATIGNLEGTTAYDLYVYSVCSGEAGRMVRYGFTTPYIPPCKIQVNFDTNDVTYTGATVVWEQQDPNQVPQKWIVRYASTDFDPATAAPSAYAEAEVLGTAGPSYNVTGLHAGDHVYLYTKAVCGGSDGESPEWSAFDFVLPDLYAPTALVNWATSNSTDSLTWTENSDLPVNTWTVAYATAPIDFTDPTAVFDTMIVHNDSVELTHLDAYASYYVYVRADAGDDHSAWSAVSTFKTICPGYVLTGDPATMTIGDGGTTNNNYIPGYNFYNYSFTQQIYTAEEIGTPGFINSIAFKNTGTTKTRTYNVYMALTDKSTFASGSDWVAMDESNKVFGGQLTFNNNEWTTIDFPTPFTYDGTSNLIVSVADVTGSYSNSPHMACLVFNATSQAIYAYRDASAYDVAAPGVNGTVLSVKNQIVMGIQPMACDLSTTCFAPTTLAASKDSSNNVALIWKARTDLKPVVKNFQVAFGEEGFADNLDADQITSAAMGVRSVTGKETDTISGNNFESLTTYDFYVRTDCGEGDYSSWAKVSLETYPEVFAPESLTATSPDEGAASSMKLSWTDKNPASAQIGTWQIAYGPTGFTPGTDAEDFDTTATTNLNFLLTGLHHSTKYDFYVRAMKDNKFSPWSPVATQATDCAPWTLTDLPISENFDSYTASSTSFATCWSRMGSSSSYINNGQHHSGSNSLYFNRSNGYGPILPELANSVNVSSLTLSFYAYFTNDAAKTTGLHVGVLTDKNDKSTFDTVATIYPTATATWESFQVDLAAYANHTKHVNHEGTRYVAILDHSSSGFGYIDDVVLKVTEPTDTLPNGSVTRAICGRYIIPTRNTEGTNYTASNAEYSYTLNATAGKVIRLTGTYDLEQGYDFLDLYRGSVAPANLVATYTGNGNIDYKTGSNLWADSGSVVLVFRTDADNGMNYEGFKLLVQCECPELPATPEQVNIDTNTFFVWTAPQGNGKTYEKHSTNRSLTAPQVVDLTGDKAYKQTNVSGICDSVAKEFHLVLHPDYFIKDTILNGCERDTIDYYGKRYFATGNYVDTLKTIHGADSIGWLALTIHEAPVAYIYYNNSNVTAPVTDYCDNAQMILEGRANMASTFEWEDATEGVNHTVFPHVLDTFTVVATDNAYGCSSLPVSIYVSTTPVADLSISATDSVICRGESTTLTLADANNVEATYRWSNNQTGTSITVTPDSTTTYTVTATTSNDSKCQTSATFTVVVNQLPEVQLTSLAEVCRDSALTLSATAVDGYTYLWSNNATTASTTVNPNVTATYSVTVTETATGCVNEFTTKPITVNPSYTVVDTMEVCFTYQQAGGYQWGQMLITEDGNYTQNFKIAHGCDSLVHVSFSFQDMATINTRRELCEGAAYTWGGITRNANLDTTLHYVSTPVDCPVDSVLMLTVNHPDSSNFDKTVCDSYTWVIAGDTVGTYTTTDAYSTILKTVKGCDSTVTLNLTVNPSNTGTDVQNVCDELEWIDGKVYTKDTVGAQYTLSNQFACDSVVTLNLTLRHSVEGDTAHMECDSRSFTWWATGETYYLDGDIRKTWAGQAANGCDTTAVLHLTMNYVTDTLNWVDVTVRDVFYLTTVDCEGNELEKEYRHSQDVTERIPNAAAGHDQWYRAHLTVNTSVNHTDMVTACVPYVFGLVRYVPAGETKDIVVNKDEYYYGGLQQPGDSLILLTLADSVLRDNSTSENPIRYRYVGTYTNNANVAFNTDEMGYSLGDSSLIWRLRFTALHPDTALMTDVVCQDKDINGNWTKWTAPNKKEFDTCRVAGLKHFEWKRVAGVTPVNHCDSIYEVNLTVNPYKASIDTLTLCESQFDTNYEYVITNPNDTTQKVTLTIAGALNEVPLYDKEVSTTGWVTSTGCDSNVTYRYTVLPTVRETVKDTACKEYVWAQNGKTYKKSGEYIDTIVSKRYGCDSIVTLQLKIYDTVQQHEYYTVCNTYEGPDGNTYRVDSTFEVVKGTSKWGCDTILYLHYTVQGMRTVYQNVLTNADYPWHGTTYKASVSGVQYDATLPNGCDSVVILNLTRVPEISLCEGQLPDTVYGVVINTVGADQQYAHQVRVNDTIFDTVINYTVKANLTTVATEDTVKCDSFTYKDSTYTASTIIRDTMTSVVTGCDSILVFNLVINKSTDSVMIATKCDSMFWNNKWYYATIKDTIDTTTTGDPLTNAVGCDSIAVLDLTINKNTKQVAQQHVCINADYAWTVSNNATNDTLMTFAANSLAAGEYAYGVLVTDANGCDVRDSLYLTIDSILHGDRDSVVNAPAAYYKENLYMAPFNSDTLSDLAEHMRFVDTLTAIGGCDSVVTTHFLVEVGDIVNDEYTACGRFTWRNGNGHTYEWIPASERVNPIFNYKDITTGQYIQENPMYSTYINDTIDKTYVLWLSMSEAAIADSVYAQFPLSQETLTIGDSTFNFAAFKALKKDTTVNREVHYGSTYYCDSIEYWTIHLKYNYDTTPGVTYVCFEDVNYKTLPAGTMTLVNDTLNKGTDNEMVMTDSIYRRAKIVETVATAITACDRYTWGNELFTSDSNGIAISRTLKSVKYPTCDSTVTFTLNITNTVHNVNNESICAHDTATFTWHGRKYQENTVDTFKYVNTSNNQCWNVDTLKLTLKNDVTYTTDSVKCDEFVWNGETFTEDSIIKRTLTSTVNGCDSVVTINLTIYNTSLLTHDTINHRGGSYRFNGRLYQSPTINDSVDIVLQNVNGCDSVVRYHIWVEQYEIEYDNVVACGLYTWPQNNHTYQWISDEERAAHGNALYKDITADTYVTSAPFDTVDIALRFLNLTLNEVVFGDTTVARFPLSQDSLILGNDTFYFADQKAAKKDTTVNVWFSAGHNYYCDSMVNATINLVYNYNTVEENVCYADSVLQWHGKEFPMPTAPQTYTFTDTVDAGMPSEQVTTKKVYRRAEVASAFDTTVCDSIRWIFANAANNWDTLITDGGIYVHNFTDVNGCDSTVTMTVNMFHDLSTAYYDTVCDKKTWNEKTYTASGTYYYTYKSADAGKCASVDTLYLVVNKNLGFDTAVVACDSYKWHGVSRTVSGTYKFDSVDANQCHHMDTIALTINTTNHYDSVIWAGEGSYRYKGVMYTADANFFDTLDITTVNGCDSIYDVTIHVGTNFYATTDTIVCSEYTWINDTTYQWISDEERAAHNALYKTRTGRYIQFMPTYVKHNEGTYDSIFTLNLTLTQRYTSPVIDTEFFVSNDSLIYGDSVFHFTTQNNRAYNVLGFSDSTFIKEVTFSQPVVRQYCDSVIVLNVTLKNNYVDSGDVHLCVSDQSFSWRGHVLDDSLATNDYDHAHGPWRLYDTLANGYIAYVTVYQHPFTYSSDRRVACDSYTWVNGQTYTESTSTATFDTVDQYGCDSVLSLVLTIKKNSNEFTDTTTHCGEYTWKTVDGHEFTFDHSVDTAYYYTATNGCPSVDSLHFVYNHIYTVAVAETACDQYVWEGYVDPATNKDTVILAGDTYKHTFQSAAGCDSTVTLTLTVNHNSNKAEYDTTYFGDTYTWHGMDCTVADTFYYQYAAALNGCPSVDTLYLYMETGKKTIADACDTGYIWHGHTYTMDSMPADTNAWTFYYMNKTATGKNLSQDTLMLTLRQSTVNYIDEVACHTYTWHGVTKTNNSDTTQYFELGYTQNAKNADNCPIFDTLRLTLGNSRVFVYEDTTSCGPYVWTVNGQIIDTLTESMQTSANVHTATGCDSVVNLTLTVYEQPVVYESAVICDNYAMPYVWRGKSYTAAVEDDTVHAPFSAQCDSIYHFTLTVNETKSTELTAQVCLGNGYQGYNFDIPADSLKESKVYTFVEKLQTINGCDSVVTLTLTVGTVLKGDTAAVACNSFDWYGQTYTTSGNYTYKTSTLTGCDSIVTLALTVNVNSSSETNVTRCDSYEWNGTVYTTSGTYTFDTTDVNGCDSVATLHLTISNSTTGDTTAVACNYFVWYGQAYVESGDYTYTLSNGENCDSVVTLHLTINQPVANTISATACGSYSWNDVSYNASGVYQQTFTAANGCDSVVTLNLTLNQPVTSSFSDTACESYTWGDAIYTTSGSYQQTYPAANGCDSIVTLNLTVNHGTHNVENAIACDNYIWHLMPHEATGTYTYEYTNVDGCASVDTLHLTINASTHNTAEVEACVSYVWHGETYTTSGDKLYHYTNGAGCASADTLHLTINQPVTNTISATACNSYTWGDAIYTTSGSYQQTFTAANGCDSIVTLTLTINQPVTSTISATACNSYTWGDAIYTTSGSYQQTYTAANGCDSVVTLNLVINEPINTTVTASNCDSYTWYDQAYTTSGTYTHDITDANGCAATATLNLTIYNSVNGNITAENCVSYTWNNQTYYGSGNYTQTFQTVHGCDSTVTLALTINQPTTGTVTYASCNDYVWNGMTCTASGIYTYNTTNAAGCDSVATLIFTRLQSVATTVNETACGSYTWNGQTYTTSGTYNHSYTATSGCDSLVTLVLTINEPINTTVTTSSCDSYTWFDVAYTTSGTYTHAITDANGCAATATLNLTIHNSVNTTVTESACSSYEWNGETYTTSGTYAYTTTSAATGCDSVTTLVLTINQPVYTNLTVTADGGYNWNGEVLTESGVYTYTTTAANGCDSIVTLELTVNPLYNVTLVSANETMGTVSESGVIVENGYFTAVATPNDGYRFVAWKNGSEIVSTTATYVFQVTEDITLTAVFEENVGIDDVDMDNVTIYSANSTIFVKGVEGQDVHVYDVNGRMMYRELNATENLEFRMTATGVYLVKVGNAPAKRVVVVR